MWRRLITLLSTLLLVTGGLHAASPIDSCLISTPTSEHPPETNTAAWSRVWYRSDDGQLWADAGRRYADGVKVAWRKPSGSTLEVTGTRLDGDAPPLEVDISDGYGGSFQASGLYFPTAGCWQVEAHAGNSTLTFVNHVYPKAFNSPDIGLGCDDVTSMINASTLILLGTVEGNYSVPGDEFIWQTIHSQQVWKGALRAGDRIDVLRDAAYDTTMAYGSTYLLFLQARPGFYVQALCPLARVDGDQLTLDAEWGALKTGQRLNDVIAEIRAAL